MARGLRDGKAIEQEAEVARSFTGSFGFVAAATDGESVYEYSGGGVGRALGKGMVVDGHGDVEGHS